MNTVKISSYSFSTIHEEGNFLKIHCVCVGTFVL